MTERTSPDPTDLRHIVRIFDESSLVELSVDIGGSRLQLSKRPAPPSPSIAPAPLAVVPAAPAAPTTGGEALGDPGPSTPGIVELRSPTVGVFDRSRPPGDAPLIEVGATVAAGDDVGVLRLPGRTVAIRAEVAGTVVELCVEDGGFVEYGQPLVRIEPR